MANDPICGMYVDERSSSLTSDKEGRRYHFCSTTCKLQFDRPELEMKILKRALLVSWPLTIMVALLTYVLRLGYGDYIMLVLASIVQFYSGQRFYAGIIDAVKNRSANMDTLIAVGTTAAWSYSAVVTLLPHAFPSGGIFFDTSTIIIALILTGTYLQRLAEERASAAVSALVSLQPKTAHVVNENVVTEVPLERIKERDVLLVKPGERIPADATIIEGESSADESMITGESMPVAKGVGDAVTGGTINVTGSVKVKVVRVGEDTTLAQIIRVVRDAASGKVPIQRLADRVASYFVPVVVLTGVLSALAWYFLGGVGPNVAMLIFVSVLIIACPCALGIATPAALLVSSGKAAEKGILVKSGESLQAAGRVNTVVLDKTGTLTNGRPEVTDIIPLSGYDDAQVLGFAAVAEINSEHVLGSAVLAMAKEKGIKADFPESFSYRPGFGVTAVDREGREITVGNTELFGGQVSEEAAEQVHRLESDGKTALVVGLDGSPVGIIALADVLKGDSKKAVDALQKGGIEVWLVTGDSRSVAEAVAGQLGIKNVISRAKPEQKMERIMELQKAGRVVAMVGDGINDAPALAKADLGIAIGAGTEVAAQAGSVVLIRNSVYDVYVVLELGKRTMSKIRQNLFWAFGYNIILIPIAAGALIPVFTISVYNVLPMLAAFAMAFSSVTVVMNSLLLGRFKA